MLEASTAHPSRGEPSPTPAIWAALRWGIAASAVIVLGACTARRLVEPAIKTRATVKLVSQSEARLDVLFAVDNSSSMNALVQSMNQNFPVFMDQLGMLPGGIPDLHVAVVSSDLGAETSDVCSFDGDAGRFQVKARPLDPTGTCPVPRGSFITATADGSGNNFDGEIRDVFACIANLTESNRRTGCGFEHQLESVRRALGGTTDAPAPAENAGFLRPNVPLAVIWLTNEDDCSVPLGSSLFRLDAADGQGPLTEFRCNEFGHTCNGAKLERNTEAANLDCRDARDDPWQRLVPVSEYVRFFERLKPHGQFVPVVIAAPPSPYATRRRTDRPDGFTREFAVGPAASCGMRPGADAAPTIFGDPAVRMFEMARAFGPTDFPSICDTDYAAVMKDVGQRLVGVLEVCVNGQVADADPATSAVEPDCQVSDRESLEDGRVVDRDAVPACGADGQLPADADACWHLVASPTCAGGAKVDIRRAPGKSRGRFALITCAVEI